MGSKRFVPPGCATALLVFGILHILVGTVILICSTITSSVSGRGSVSAPYWTAIPVSRFLLVNF